MERSLFSPERFFKSACLFEGALILVAIVLGWLGGIDPFALLHFSESAVFNGVMGTLPLFLLFLLSEQMDFRSVASIRDMLRETMGASLHHYHWADWFMLAAIAGIAEEVLFRGVIQPWMQSTWGCYAGLLASNLIFGLVHAVTPLYAILAAFVGIYLGLAMDFGGESNLLTPILIHGLYDFLAFWVIVRSYRAAKNS